MGTALTPPPPTPPRRTESTSSTSAASSTSKREPLAMRRWLFGSPAVDSAWLNFQQTVPMTTVDVDPAASGRRRRLAGAHTRSCISPPMRPALAAVGVGASGALWPHRRRRRPSPRGSRPRSVSRRGAVWPPPLPPGCRSCYLMAVGPLLGRDGHGGNGQFGIR